LKFYKNDGGAG